MACASLNSCGNVSGYEQLSLISCAATSIPRRHDLTPVKAIRGAFNPAYERQQWHPILIAYTLPPCPSVCRVS